MATLTITEGFKGAFEVGDILELEVAGLQKGVELQVGVAATDDGKAFPAPAEDGEDGDDGEDDGPVPVASGTTKLTGDADGEDQTADIGLGNVTPGMMGMGTRPTEITLTLTLTAPMNDDVTFPLNMGDITARVTFVGMGLFENAFTPSAVIFEIRPAQCTMLFPVVTVMDPWQTVISISNPAYGDEPADGSLEFTFYRQASEGMNFEPVRYTTGPESPGSGLEVDGTLAAGSTYQAYIRDILAAAEWGETFVGHVHVTADYTGCTGLGWVTDFATVNQAYLAVVLDSDTGKAN